MQINTDKIGLLIGPGGKTIRSIIGNTDADINIEPDGKVFISAPNEEIGNMLKDKVLALVEEPEVGKVYLGKVVEIRDFGAFVQILPSYVGLLHVSQIADRYVKDIRKEVHVGDEFPVKVMKIDENGKIQLTKKGVEKKDNGRKK